MALLARMIAIAVILTALFTSMAYGQHAQFVLLGDPNPEAADVPVHQKAVHPITAPFFHEDSFVTSDVRVWYLYHDFDSNNVLGNGHANAVAAQLRLALTDQLQFVAYKDGWININTPVVDEDGFFDLAAGLKWNFYQNWKQQLHAAVGAGYEFRTGEGEVLQNDSEARFWASVNKGFDRLHLGAMLNGFVGVNGNDGLGNSDRISWHLHADYAVTDWFSSVVEVSGYHTIHEQGAVLNVSGVDVANLGGG